MIGTGNDVKTNGTTERYNGLKRKEKKKEKKKKKKNIYKIFTLDGVICMFEKQEVIESK